jgi:predicted PurR-regulated permease PerM
MSADDEPSPQPAPSLRPRAQLCRLRTDTVLLAFAIGLLLWLTAKVLLVVFAGILLAIALDALASPVCQHTRLSHGRAVAAVVAALVLLFGAGGMVIVPQFMHQLGEIWLRLLELGGQAQQALHQHPWAQQFLRLGEQVGANGRAGETGVIAGHIVGAMRTVLGLIATTIVIAVLGVFIGANPALYLRGLLKLVPFGHRRRSQEVLAAVGHALRWWLIGQLIAMLVVGITSSVGLLVLGVDLWFGLGVLVGLFNFIPFLGPILGGAPAVVISLAESTHTGLMVLAFFVVLQNLEGNILTPLIQQHAIHLPPALLITTQVLLGTLFGTFGLILAAPLAVVGMVAVNLLYVEDVLGDRPATPRGRTPPAAPPR